MVRCKFCLSSITNNAWGVGQTFVFSPIYDTSIEEDRRFAKASPSGRFDIHVDNPVAQKAFVLGQYYYFDMTPVPSKTAE